MSVFKRTPLKLPPIMPDEEKKTSMFSLTYTRQYHGVFTVYNVAPLTAKQLKINAKRYWKNVILSLRSVRVMNEIMREVMDAKAKEEEEDFVPLTRRRSQTWGGSELPFRQKMTKNMLQPKSASEEFRSCFLTSEVIDDEEDNEDEVADESIEVLTFPAVRVRSNSCGCRPRCMTLSLPKAGKTHFQLTSSSLSIKL